MRIYLTHKRFVTVCALDQGSVSTPFIFESLVQRLRLSKINRFHYRHERNAVLRHTAQITIIPAYRDRPAYTTTAFILRSLMKYLSNQINTMNNWKHVTGLELANRDPMSSGPIDIIIGTDLFVQYSERF